MMREFKAGKVYQGSLAKGVDLIEGLSAVMKENGINAGIVSIIGRKSNYRRSGMKRTLEVGLVVTVLLMCGGIRNAEAFGYVGEVCFRIDYPGGGNRRLCSSALPT